MDYCVTGLLQIQAYLFQLGHHKHSISTTDKEEIKQMVNGQVVFTEDSSGCITARELTSYYSGMQHVLKLGYLLL